MIYLPVVTCDCAVSGLRFDSLAVGTHQHRGHHAERTETLGHDVRLYIAVVVLAGPHKFTFGFQCLGNHIIDQTVLVPDFQRFELLFVVPVINANEW